MHHTVENVPDHQGVCAFKEGVNYRELNLKFGRAGEMSLNRMMEIATKYANGEDEDRLRSGKHKAVAQETGGNSSRKQKRKAEPAAPGEALAVTQGKFKGKPKGPWNPKKLKTKMEMMFWIYRVTSTPRKMKRVNSFTQSIPLDSVGF